MAEKSEKSEKKVSITLVRERLNAAPIVIGTGFKLRPEKGTGLLDVFIEGLGQKSARVCFDPVIVRTNLDMLKRYAAGILTDPDDSAPKEDVPATEQVYFSNVIHLSQTGGRAETIFGVFRLAEWVEATQKTDGKPAQITTSDSFVVMSSPGWQKKFVLELLLALSHHSKE